MRQTDVKRTEERTEFTLSLTADELTWLLLEIFPLAEKKIPHMAADIRQAKEEWRDEAYKQGWKPF